MAFNRSGAVHVAPLSCERDTKISLGMVPLLCNPKCQTATEFPMPSDVTCGNSSLAISSNALMFSRLGAVQVVPLSVDRDTKISLSVPEPARSSVDSQTAPQLPEPSVVTCGNESCPESVVALVLSKTGGEGEICAVARAMGRAVRGGV